MSPEATLRQIIRRTERILPGTPAPDGEEDYRWQAIMRTADQIREQPEPVWEFTRKWGKHPQKDLRTAVAVLLLEHLLEYHFQLIYPRVRDEVKASKRFVDTLGRCYWLGEAGWPSNARKLDKLAGVRRQRLHPKRPAARRTT